MKKAIVLLLALILVGAAFAQTAAPAAAPAAPTTTVTFGLLGDVRYNAIAPNNVATYGSDFVGVAKDINKINAISGTYLPENSGTYQFQIQPSFKVVTGDFNYGAKFGVFGDDSIGAYLYGGYSKDGLTINNNLYLDRAGYWQNSNLYGIYSTGYQNYTDITVAKDNVTGYVNFGGDLGWSGALTDTANGVFEKYIQGMRVIEAYYNMANLFDMLTVEVGASNGNIEKTYALGRQKGFYAHSGSQSYLGLGNGEYADADITAQNVNVYSTLDFNTALKLPLVAYAGYTYDLANSTALINWLAAGNMHYGVTYTMKDIVSLDAGFEPVFPYSANIAAGPLWVVNAKTAPLTAKGLWINQTLATGSTFWLDANVVAVKDLMVIVGIDGAFNSYLSKLAADTKGTGTAADPLKPTWVDYSKMAFGLEAKYSLDAAVKGLAVYAKANVQFGSGYDLTKVFGDAVNTDDLLLAYLYQGQTTANTFKVNSWASADVAAKKFYGIAPMAIAAKAVYTQDKFVAVLEGTYTAKAVDLASFTDGGAKDGIRQVGEAWKYYTTAPITKRPVGYVDTFKIAPSIDIKPDAKSTISLGVGYTVYMGLPSATDLGLTDGSGVGTYKAADVLATDTTRPDSTPWSLSLRYKASF